jgi:WD40 repeat protein
LKQVRHIVFLLLIITFGVTGTLTACGKSESGSANHGHIVTLTSTAKTSLLVEGATHSTSLPDEGIAETGDNNPTLRPTRKPAPTSLQNQDATATPKESLTGEVRMISFSPWELVTALAWSQDGKMLAVASGNSIHLYDVGSLEEIGTMEVGAMSPAVKFDPSGKWLAAASRDGNVRVWRLDVLMSDLNAGRKSEPFWLLEAHKKGANDLAFYDVGKAVASGGNDGIVRTWNLETGDLIDTLIGGTFSVPSLAVNPQRPLLAMVNGDVIRFRDLMNGQIWGTIRSKTSLYCLDISPDGNLVASGDNENHVYFWKIDEAYRTGVEQYPQPVVIQAHEGKVGTYHALVWDVVFSPDGLVIASAGGDGLVHLWNLSNMALMGTFDRHKEAVTSVAFSPDGGFIASGGLDNVVYIWSVAKIGEDKIE